MFVIEHSTEIAFRNDFSLLCNARGIIHAIEVGTDRGIFAADFLRRWNGTELVLIDDYAPYFEMNYARDTDLMQAVLALQPFHGRYKFIQVPSPEAAKHVPPWIHPRFIYIDAAHDYESVRRDLDVWWEKLEADGILAGHDFDDSHPGVIQAVTEFAKQHQAVVRLTQEVNASWYIYKPEPPDLKHNYFRTGDSPNTRFGK